MILKIIKNIGKIVLAGITACAILSILLIMYDFTPIHYENPKKNTDYIWEPNSFYVKLTEGISWGKMDSDGFNNPVVIKNPEIITLGSSHMDGTYVFYNQTVGSILAEKLNHRYSVYNLGTSEHNIYRVCQYLPVNLSMHDIPPKIVIIETSTVNLTMKNVRAALNFEYEHIPSKTTGMYYIFQRIPFLKSLSHQVRFGLLNIFMQNSTTTIQENDDEVYAKEIEDDKVDELAFDELFSFLSELEKEYGTQIIIFYHPTGTFTESGDIVFKSSNALIAFGKFAEKYNIDFVDMTAKFEDMYYTDHLVAHGFITGKLCYGHLNANGHRAIADELFKVIEQLEKEGTLCK